MHWIKVSPSAQPAYDFHTLAALLILGGIGLLFLVLMVRLFRGGRARLPCRWQRDKGQRRGSLTRYTCRTCGVEAFTSNGRLPEECKRALRARPL